MERLSRNTPDVEPQPVWGEANKAVPENLQTGRETARRVGAVSLDVEKYDEQVLRDTENVRQAAKETDDATQETLAATQKTKIESAEALLKEASEKMDAELKKQADNHSALHTLEDHARWQAIRDKLGTNRSELARQKQVPPKYHQERVQGALRLTESHTDLTEETTDALALEQLGVPAQTFPESPTEQQMSRRVERIDATVPSAALSHQAVMAVEDEQAHPVPTPQSEKFQRSMVPPTRYIPAWAKPPMRRYRRPLWQLLVGVICLLVVVAGLFFWLLNLVL